MKHGISRGTLCSIRNNRNLSTKTIADLCSIVGITDISDFMEIIIEE